MYKEEGADKKKKKEEGGGTLVYIRERRCLIKTKQQLDWESPFLAKLNALVERHSS